MDLTLAGLGDPAVCVWVDRAESGGVICSTGFELSADGKHALIRSVAVASGRRTSGAGTRLARFAMERARIAGRPKSGCFHAVPGRFGRSSALSALTGTNL